MTSAQFSNIVFDIRCLQDPNYAERGVGRHARGLLRHAMRLNGLRRIGLVDAALPPLAPDLRELVHDTAPNAYAAMALSGFKPGCFVSLSPMTHDPLWTARLMGDARWMRASIVYDFIPRLEPDRYLPTGALRLQYAAQLNWLAQSDMFATISQSTAHDLRHLLAVPAQNIIVTGCSVDPIFEQARGMLIPGQQPRHILVVAGGDPRKNPETIVRAHARAVALQCGAGVPLVIVGRYSGDEAAALRATATEAGGRPDLVEFPGHVSDGALLDLYAGTISVVSASRAEGFSLPLAEGMTAGVPVVASDIPAHRELIEDPALRFDPDDDATLTTLLERMTVDAAWRHAITARQDALWPRFRADEVASRLWDALLGRLPATAPAVLRKSRPRIALLSPLPPDRSGVADYTAATCSELGSLVDLHLFTEAKRPRPMPASTSIRPLSALPHVAAGFDRVVSVVGNSHFHLRIFDMMHRHGAACIAHDARMLGFYCGLLGRERSLAVAGRELGRQVEEGELDTWLADESRMEALFLGEIAESASPMIVHSPVTAREVRRRHDVCAVHIPFALYRSFTATDLTIEARALARARLGFAKGEVAIATFGFVHSTKAPAECVWALYLLRAWGMPATLHFVGGTDHMADRGAALRALIERLRLSHNVCFGEGFVRDQAYRDYLVGADLGIQLRTYGLGGLSGALMDCASAGLPTVTNLALAEAVGVPATYIRAIPDAISPILLAEALAELLEVGLAERPEAERRSFSEDRSQRNYARALCHALSLDLPADAPRRLAV
jgi:glycosyltransferase involved in cell wall biosynthesis